MTTMRFGPFVWPVNPTEIRVEGGRSTREALFPSPSLQEEGEKLRRVTGRGVFTGPDAAAQFSALHALLETGGAEILTVPEYGPLAGHLNGAHPPARKHAHGGIHLRLPRKPDGERLFPL